MERLFLCQLFEGLVKYIRRLSWAIKIRSTEMRQIFLPEGRQGAM